MPRQVCAVQCTWKGSDHAHMWPDERDALCAVCMLRPPPGPIVWLILHLEPLLPPTRNASESLGRRANSATRSTTAGVLRVATAFARLRSVATIAPRPPVRSASLASGKRVFLSGVVLSELGAGQHDAGTERAVLQEGAAAVEWAGSRTDAAPPQALSHIRQASLVRPPKAGSCDSALKHGEKLCMSKSKQRSPR